MGKHCERHNPLAATKDSCVVNGTRSAGGGFEQHLMWFLLDYLGLLQFCWRSHISRHQDCEYCEFFGDDESVLFRYVQVKTTTHDFLSKSSKSLNPQPTSEICRLVSVFLALTARVQMHLSGATWPCLGGKTHWFHCAIWRSGGSSLVIVMPCFMTGNGASKFR